MKEYIYLPASELDTDHPIAVYEHGDGRDDITLEEAVSLIEHRSLKPAKHPVFGERTV